MFGGLIQEDNRKKNGKGLGAFSSGPSKVAPGQNASSQEVDMMALLTQPQNFGTQAPMIDPGVAPIPNLTGGPEQAPMDEGFGVPGQTILPEFNSLGLTGAEMEVGTEGSLGLGSNPGMMSSVSQPGGGSPVQPLAPMQLPQRKDKGGFFNFTGSDNVFLRGAQGLEDGGILGLIGQILNR